MKKDTKNIRRRLMARTCELILTEGQFDMHQFTGRGEDKPPVCGTACCIAGNIEIARRELKVRVTPIAGDVTVEDKTVLRADKVWDTLLHPGRDSDFYGRFIDLRTVTPEMAVANVMTGERLRSLAHEPLAVEKAVRSAKRLIRAVKKETAQG